MELIINGVRKSFGDAVTLSEMIEKLKIDTTGIVIERNLEIVSRSEYRSLLLKDGDKIELIRLVSGG